MSKIAVKWIGIAGSAAAIVWYTGGFDFRSAKEAKLAERHEMYCGFFASSGAITDAQISECTKNRDVFMGAADKAAEIDAAADAKEIEEVASYLRERGNILNLNEFEALDSARRIPSNLNHEASEGERPDYDRRYVEVVDLTIMSKEDDDPFSKSFTLFARRASADEGDRWILPDPTGAWTQALDRLTYRCPNANDPNFDGCQATIFLEAVPHPLWDWDPATTFMLLKPIDEAALRKHYRAQFRSRW